MFSASWYVGRTTSGAICGTLRFCPAAVGNVLHSTWPWRSRPSPVTFALVTDPAPQAPIDSALPSTTARVLAFAAIVVSGICGGLIGWRVAELSISGDGGLIPGLAGLLGALVGAGGVAVVAVLVLRAMGEWRTIVETGDPAAARRGRRPDPR